MAALPKEPDLDVGRWQKVKQPIRQTYLKNAHSVLSTRAGRRLAIVVPGENSDDATQAPEFDDEAFAYIRVVGFGAI